MKMNALRLEEAKKYVQNRTCSALNIGILEKKDSCPKKPEPEPEDKQKTKAFRCVDTLGQMRNQMYFF